MKQLATLIWSGIGLFVFVMLGYLGDQVGGIAIRNNVARVRQFELIVSQPIIRGVPILVHWNYETNTSQQVFIIWRDSSGEYVLAESSLLEKNAVVILPCATKDIVGSLIVRDAATQEVLATTSVELLAPGPECVVP